MKFTALIGTERTEVDLHSASLPSVRARVGDREYELELREVEPGVFWFLMDGRSIEAAVMPNGEGYTVRLGNEHIRFELLDRRSLLQRSGAGATDGLAELRAPMPGKVVKLLVEEGDVVEAGQGLLVIEAMKMQNEMRSPKSGTIEKLAVEEGMTVSSGDLLAAVE